MHAKHSGRLTSMHSGRLIAVHSGRKNGSKILLSEPNIRIKADFQCSHEAPRSSLRVLASN